MVILIGGGDDMTCLCISVRISRKVSLCSLKNSKHIVPADVQVQCVILFLCHVPKLEHCLKIVAMF